LSGRDHNEDDSTIIYMVGCLYTLDNHFDNLLSHYTHLNSRVENLEQQIKELKEEKVALQDSLEIAEGEEANTCGAYRTLKMDYARRMKKLTPSRRSESASRAKDARLTRRKKPRQHYPP
jgi:outer membrane murein-binding lipoprotein Lpp